MVIKEPFQPSFAALAETAVRCELVLDDDGDGMVTVTRSDPERPGEFLYDVG